MTFSFAQLPIEVKKIIRQCKTPQGVADLGKRLPLTITRRLYHSFFHDNAHFSHYTIRMLEERAKARLVVLKEQQPELFHWKSGFTEPFPISYDIGKEYIVDHCLTLDSDNVHILTSDGRIYFGKLFGYQVTELEPVRARVTEVCEHDKEIYDESRREQEEDFAEYWEEKKKYTRELKRYKKGKTTTRPKFTVCSYFENYPEESIPDRRIVEYTNRLCNLPYKPTQFVEMATENQAFAVDNAGILWTFPDYHHDTFGLPVCLTYDGNPVTKISKLRLGECYTTCVVKGLGIVRLEFDPFNALARPDLCRDGIPCCKGYFFDVEAELVDGTTGSVLDHNVFQDYCVFLTAEGEFGAEPLFDAQKDYLRRVDEINKNGPFVQLVANIERICLLSKTGRVVVVINQNNVLVPMTKFGLDDYHIASIGMTTKSLLFLTNSGCVYSANFTWKCIECQREHYADKVQRYRYRKQFGRDCEDSEELESYLGLDVSDDSMSSGYSSDYSCSGPCGHRRSTNEDVLAIEDSRIVKLPGKAYSIEGRGPWMSVLVYEDEPNGKSDESIRA